MAGEAVWPDLMWLSGWRHPTGGPTMSEWIHTVLIRFLSTPSAGRATNYLTIPTVPNMNFYPRPPWGGRRGQGRKTQEICDFYPRPPWGGRPALSWLSTSTTRFLSTPSVGRATDQHPCAASGCTISIHALRGEGDNGKTRPSIIQIYFYPRPPWGGRPRMGKTCCASCPFLSTPSVGRATPGLAGARGGLAISIHALRGEGDKVCGAGRLWR